MKSVQAVLDNVSRVLGAREKNYDNPAPNFTRIAAYWSLYLEAQLTHPLTAKQIADLMILMKMAREQYQHKPDNLLDAIGYAVCGLRIADQDLPVQEDRKD